MTFLLAIHPLAFVFFAIGPDIQKINFNYYVSFNEGSIIYLQGAGTMALSLAIDEVTHVFATIRKRFNTLSMLFAVGPVTMVLSTVLVAITRKLYGIYWS